MLERVWNADDFEKGLKFVRIRSSLGALGILGHRITSGKDNDGYAVDIS